MPGGTAFIPFAKPGNIKEGMDDWLIKHESIKTEKAERWFHACGRQDFMSLNQITKDTYICSLRFIKDNPDQLRYCYV